MIVDQPHRPLCAHCKFTLAKPNGKSKHGFQKWHKYCVECAKAIYNKRFNHLKNKATSCEQCGFVPEDLVQLDVVYIDGNKLNKAASNLKTMCANCSRLHNKKCRNRKKSILNATVDIDTTII